MIVDCFTHTWESDEQLGTCSNGKPRADASGNDTVAIRPNAAHHRASADLVDATLVFGFHSVCLGAQITNDDVARYVQTKPDRLVGIAGVDPSVPKQALADLDHAKSELGMAGVAVAPAAQDFHPSSTQAMLVYAKAAEMGMPIVFHTGIRMCPATKLDFARPFLLDEIARELPEARILIAHMGLPWIDETIELLAKHDNVFAEISWLMCQPWRAYQTLVKVHQRGVIDKLLFGSGFPMATASQCIEALYSINHHVHGTSLPTVPRDQLQGIVQRNALDLLGINSAGYGRPLTQEAAAPTAEEN